VLAAVLAVGVVDRVHPPALLPRPLSAVHGYMVGVLGRVDVVGCVLCVWGVWGQPVGPGLAAAAPQGEAQVAHTHGGEAPHGDARVAEDSRVSLNKREKISNPTQPKETEKLKESYTEPHLTSPDISSMSTMASWMLSAFDPSRLPCSLSWIASYLA
jgi:hypothetical protein